jgi:hypothetical protein
VDPTRLWCQNLGFTTWTPCWCASKHFLCEVITDAQDDMQIL